MSNIIAFIPSVSFLLSFDTSEKYSPVSSNAVIQIFIYLAPYAVFLNADETNYVEPDISVICDKSKLDERGCNGAPDWIIEVVSPSTERMDYGIKLFKYRSAGVREYWIVNPFTHSKCL
ncbi:MAG: Uma2 family endonuclease [Acetatifactor sp.]|nr:Uma2 family endonuclease [Acetatifactor sp.]